MNDSCQSPATSQGLSPAAWSLLFLSLLALGAGLLTLFQFDPETVDWLPKCPVYQVFGWHCPGCGATRAAHALLNGNVSGAMAKNPLLITAGPFLVAFCFWKRRRSGPGWATTISARAVLVFLCVLVTFAVLRNLPGYPFELLAPH